MVTKMTFAVRYVTPVKGLQGEKRVTVRVEPGLYYENPGACQRRAHDKARARVAKNGSLVTMSVLVKEG